MEPDDIRWIFQPHIRRNLEKFHIKELPEEIEGTFVLPKRALNKPKREGKRRWTVLVGNGLCRAFDQYNDRFNLTSIINNLGQASEFEELSAAMEFLSTQGPGQLSIEDALGTLEILSETQDSLARKVRLGLTEEVSDQQAPKAIRRPDTYRLSQFRYQLLKQIHDASEELQREPLFSRHAEDFLAFLKSHQDEDEHLRIDVATLNYETSLYRKLFCSNEDWFRKHYSDGFYADEKKIITKDKICQRVLDKRKSRYLHLHGSYLFVEEGRSGTFRKEENTWFPPSQKEAERLVIVLTNQKEKLRSVKFHDLLDEYHMAFRSSIGDCEKLIVFGYGGGDEYLNEVIRARLSLESAPEVLIVQGEYSANPRSDKIAGWQKWLHPGASKIQEVSTPHDLLFSNGSGRNRIYFTDSLANFKWPI